MKGRFDMVLHKFKYGFVYSGVDETIRFRRYCVNHVLLCSYATLYTPPAFNSVPFADAVPCRRCQIRVTSSIDGRQASQAMERLHDSMARLALTGQV